MKRNLMRFAIALLVVSLMGRSGSVAATKARPRKAKPAISTTTTTKPIRSPTSIAATTFKPSEAQSCDVLFDINDNGKVDCLSVKLFVPPQFSRKFDVRIDVTLDGGTQTLTMRQTVVGFPSYDQNISLSVEASAAASKDWLKVWGISGRASKILWISVVNLQFLRPFEVLSFYPIQISKDSIRFVMRTDDVGQTLPAEVLWQQSVSKTDTWFGCEGDDRIVSYEKVRYLDGIGTQETHYEIVDGTLRLKRVDEPRFSTPEFGEGCGFATKVPVWPYSLGVSRCVDSTPSDAGIQAIIGGTESTVWVTQSASTVANPGTSRGAFDVGITVKRGNETISGEKLILNANDSDVRISSWGAVGKERLVVAARGGVYLFRVEGCNITQLRGPGAARDGSTFSLLESKLSWGSYPWTTRWVCNPVTDSTETITSYGALKTTYSIVNDQLVVAASTKLDTVPPESSCGSLTFEK